MNRNMIGLAYGDAAASGPTAPVAGNRTSGRRDAAGMGTASDIHQTATHAVDAATACAAYERPSGGRRGEDGDKEQGTEEETDSLAKTVVAADVEGRAVVAACKAGFIVGVAGVVTVAVVFSASPAVADKSSGNLLFLVGRPVGVFDYCRGIHTEETARPTVDVPEIPVETG